jgi:hypothetical protein
MLRFTANRDCHGRITKKEAGFMKTAKTQYSVFSGLVMIIFCLSFFAVSTELSAQTVVIKGVGFNTAGSLKDNLDPLVGKDIFVSIRSGKVYQGFVKSVGNNFVHLEKIAGKDFYDVLIRMDDISAIEAKFRDFK